MANLTTVGLTAGAGSSGTGTVSTLDNVIGTAGTASAQVLSVQGITSMTPVKVDGSGVTQPVSGTVTINAIPTGTNVIGSVKATDGTNTAAVKAASTAPVATDSALVVAISPNSVNANGQATMANSAPVTIASNQSNLSVIGAGTAGTANSGVVTVQGIASMTKLLVTPDSVALPANQSVNLAQVAGATTAVGSGVQATALRTTLATDSPGIVTLGQTTKSASVPVTVASDQGSINVAPQAIATGGATYAHVAAGQATTVIKASAGTLYAITFNSAAAATNVTTIYDNATGSGTVIAIPAATTATVPTDLNFGPTGLNFANGLTIITTTANGSDMTVVYK